MKNHSSLKSTGVCRSIVSGQGHTRRGLISRRRSRHFNILNEVNVLPVKVDKAIKSNVCLSLEAVNNIFSVLIISELNSPFSFV